MNDHQKKMLSMYQDVESFHIKFGLPRFPSIGEMPKDLLDFRALFLKEEAQEIWEATATKNKTAALDGFVDLAYVALGTAWLSSASRLDVALANQDFSLLGVFGISVGIRPEEVTVELCASIASGCRVLALDNGFDFDEGWRRVHAANMSKVRATDATGKRKSQWDVVKPEGWVAPTMEDLV
jgi:predicted HAD superfamily Cof-like phosphohydrolase